MPFSLTNRMHHARQKGNKDALKDLKVSWGRLEHEWIISIHCLGALIGLCTGCHGNMEREPFTVGHLEKIWTQCPPELRCESCARIGQASVGMCIPAKEFTCMCEV